MTQQKTVMSNSYMKWARKKQEKESKKQAAKRNKEYEINHFLKMQELRDAPTVHEFNNLDTE